MTNKKRLGLAVPFNLYERIKSRAEYQGKTINSLCLDVLWEYFEEKTEKSTDAAGSTEKEYGKA